VLVYVHYSHGRVMLLSYGIQFWYFDYNCRLKQHRETEQYTLSTDNHKRNLYDFDALFTCLDVFLN